MPSQHEFVLTTVLCQNDVVSKRCCGNTVSCQYDAMSKQHHAKNDGVTKRRRLKTMSHLKWHSVNMAPCHNDVVSMRRRAKRTSCQNDVVYSRRHVNTMPCECVVVSKRGHVNTVSCQYSVVSRRLVGRDITVSGQYDNVSRRRLLESASRQDDVLSKTAPYKNNVLSRRCRVKTTSCQHDIVSKRCRVNTAA